MNGQYEVSTTPGYPPDRRVGVINNLAARYLCSSCGDLLRDAVQTGCGHRYCKSCVEQCLRNDSTTFCCVMDGEVIHKDQVFNDNYMRREILSLMVSCTFRDEGCAWRGEVRHFEEHKVTCEFMEVRCVHEACGLLIKRGDLGHHLATECSYRLAKCPVCDAEISYNLMKEHLRTYHKHLHCEMDNLRDVVDDVLRTREDLQEGQRDLQEGQRDLQEGQRDLQEGQRGLQEGQRGLQEGQRDLQEGQRDLREGQRDLQERQRDLQEGQRDLQEGQRDLQEGQRDLQEGQRDLQEGQRDLQEGQRHVRELQKRIDELQNEFRVLQESWAESIRSREDQKMEQDLFNDILANLQDASDKALHKSVGRQEHSLQLRPAFRRLTLDDLEEYVKEFSSYDGQLLWKISDYARRRNDAVTRQQASFFSPCFYTSRHGYKLGARIYLNGDGVGRGTHISLFLLVMRGDYDALLRWPFRQKVTFMLLDQDNVAHVTDAFRPDPSSSSFQRPRRETNIASGCPTFCPLSELNNHAYVRDDTMFVKIIVDTSDL